MRNGARAEEPGEEKVTTPEQRFRYRRFLSCLLRSPSPLPLLALKATPSLGTRQRKRARPHSSSIQTSPAADRHPRARSTVAVVPLPPQSRSFGEKPPRPARRKTHRGASQSRRVSAPRRARSSHVARSLWAVIQVRQELRDWISIGSGTAPVRRMMTAMRTNCCCEGRTFRPWKSGRTSAFSRSSAPAPA